MNTTAFRQWMRPKAYRPLAVPILTIIGNRIIEDDRGFMPGYGGKDPEELQTLKIGAHQ